MTDHAQIARSRVAQFPSALVSRSRLARLADDIPALLAHPDWKTPAPVVLWFHGRTAYKELDSGRYLRWVRGGIAACAIDLPGHGERTEPGRQEPAETLGVLEQAIGEIDSIVDALRAPEYRGILDTSRLAIGGMSAGGMVTLRRLCDPHPFRCASVEATAGWLEGLYFPDRVEAVLGPGAGKHTWSADHSPEKVARLDTLSSIESFRPIPLLAQHSRADRIVPYVVQAHFIDMLKARYRARGVDDRLVELQSWEQTGAPEEHIGFGRVSPEAKTGQLAFLTRWLAPTPLQE